MLKRLVILFALAGLIVAYAKSYTVTIYQAATVGGVELKPGDYRLTITGDKAELRNGKLDAQASVKVETADGKYPSTSVLLSEKSGKQRIAEIRLGGTTTRLVFND